MPTSAHELPLEMVRNRPQLVPTILRTVFGLDILGEPSITSESFADLSPAELRCDATVLFDTRDKRTHGVIVESQQRFDSGKRYSWPAYIALLRLRHKCGATLLVLCPDENSARRCAAPIDMGHPRWVLEPLTVHPGLLPPITDPDEAARMPELAVLSAPAHADGPHASAVVSAVAAAIDTLTGDTGPLYHDYLRTLLSDAARKLLEDTVTTAGYEWQSDFAKTHIAEGRAEGRAEGEADAVLSVLETRGITVPNDIRDKVTGCTDIDQLKRWVRRAVVIDHAEELFD
ncbi:hypothetical protein ACQPZ8_11510 [Actinomadura nitritigenes]|uniref:hypothetical protein n=1 Tax=Actinomadura nitritigenes TaxID=134602 RepID=UPI003D91A45E